MKARIDSESSQKNGSVKRGASQGKKSTNETASNRPYNSLEALLGRRIGFIAGNDQILYDYCLERGCPAEPGAFDGTDDVGDFLAKFAEDSTNAQYMLSLGKGATYDIYRLGSITIESPLLPKEGQQQLPEPSRHTLTISADPESPHAKFKYKDKPSADPEKPIENKGMWWGRVVVTHDALYLVGITEEFTDVTMMILWAFPGRPDVLVGIQLAKLQPRDEDSDKRDFVTSRRVVAVKVKRGPKEKGGLISKDLVEWLTCAPTGTVFRIDKTPPRRSNSD